MAKLSDVIGRGLASNKPGSPTEGYLYYSTDLAVLERYSGSAWEPVTHAGLLYQFSTTTTDADPGAGYIRFNNGTPGSVTIIYVDDQPISTDADIGTLLDNSSGGYVIITQANDPSKYLLGTVTADEDGTGYWKLTVTVNDSGTLPDDDALLSVLIYTGGGGGGGSSYTDSQEHVKQALMRGMMRYLWKIHHGSTLTDPDSGLAGGSDTDLTQTFCTPSDFTAGWNELTKRSYPQFEETSVTTANNAAYYKPDNGARLYQGKAPFLWALDMMYADSSSTGTDRDFYMFMDADASSHPTDTNVRDWIGGTYYGRSGSNTMQGCAGIVQEDGATPKFITADGTTQESTTLTGIDLLDGNWHDIAIYHDGSGNWSAIIDGAVAATHSTNVPNQNGTPTTMSNIYACAGPGVSNSASTSGTFGWAKTYNIGCEMPGGTAAQDLLDILSSV